MLLFSWNRQCDNEVWNYRFHYHMSKTARLFAYTYDRIYLNWEEVHHEQMSRLIWYRESFYYCIFPPSVPLPNGCCYVVGSGISILSFLGHPSILFRNYIVNMEKFSLFMKIFSVSLLQIIWCDKCGMQVVLVSATLPHEILEMTNKFMTDPVRILVKRDELTLEVR
jgi:hypothetical protein